MTTTKRTALDEYMANVQDIKEMLSGLAYLNDEHYGKTPDEITWGNVGDTNWIKNTLHEVMQFVGGEEV